MHGRLRQQRGHRRLFGADAAIAQDDQRAAALDRRARLVGDRLQPHVEGLGAAARREHDVDRHRLQRRRRGELLELAPAENRRAQHDARRTRRQLVDEAAVPAEHRRQRHDRRFAVRIDRRVGDLREPLAEEIAEQARPLRQRGGRRVVAHRADRLVAVGDHRLEQQLDFLARAAERRLAARSSVGADPCVRPASGGPQVAPRRPTGQAPSSSMPIGSASGRTTSATRRR